MKSTNMFEYNIYKIAYRVAKTYMVARRIAFKDPSRITVNDRRNYVKYMLSNNDGWALRAIQKIFERQTFDEQSSEQTHHLNQMGFTGVDAQFLTSLVKQLKQRGSLSPKQMYLVKRMMPKYWMQIIEIADKTKLDAQVLNWKLQQTPNLPMNASKNINANVDFIQYLEEYDVVQVNVEKMVKYFERNGIAVDDDVDMSYDEINFAFNGLALDGNVESSALTRVEREIKQNKYVDFIRADTYKYRFTIKFVKNIESN